MKKFLPVLLGGGLILAFLGFFLWQTRKTKEVEPMAKNNSFLPEPRLKGEISLEEAIFKRRSQRNFLNKPLSLSQLSQILWAAQGVTDKSTGFRTAPSAGALYPLEIYLLVKEKGVEGLEVGVYHYQPEKHSLELYLKGYSHSDFVRACLNQQACNLAPVSLVIAAEYERTTGKYGERGKRYVEIEVGHVGQNIYLQAETLGLGTVAIGAFIDGEISQVLNLPPSHKPLYIMPIGYPK